MTDFARMNDRARAASLESLLPLDDAVATVIRVATELRDGRAAETRHVGLWDASGYVLAEDILADRDQPPFAKAMMDGFAVRSADLTTTSTAFTVIGECAAGYGFDGTVGPGEAVAIMTGAPVPPGADCVQMIERTRRDGETVVVEGPLAAGHNVAAQGEDTRVGDVVVEKGRVIESLTAGVIGSVGRSRFDVFQRPRVHVMTTGDELVALDAEPGAYQIRDSNCRTLMAMLDREWCRLVDGGICADTMEATRAAIRDGLESDVLVLSGGVSAGTYDLVAEALAEEGVEIVFHKTRIKPGKPVLFGRHAGGLVFGLPGNPVSAYVTAVLLLTPAVRVLGRRPNVASWYLDLPLSGTIPRTQGRTTFHPGDIVRDQGETMVRYRPWGGSADHVGYARANVLIRREPHDPEANEGDRVRVVLPHQLASW